LTYGKRFAEKGAWGVTFHIEVAKDPAETARTLRSMGVRPAVAINPPTPVEALEKALDHVDMVLVMSVNPGFGGQKFIADVLAKVEALRGRYGFGKDVEMDGGIAPETVASCAAAGANVLVAGTAVYGAKDYAAAISDLRVRAERAAAGAR
jgi:ribulose-phosphate 3-epimerase